MQTQYPSKDSDTVHLDTIMEIATKDRWTLEVEFQLSQQDLEKLHTKFFLYSKKNALKYFTDLFFDDEAFKKISMPLVYGKTFSERKITVTRVLRLTDLIGVFMANVGSMKFVLKCSMTLYHNQFNRDRFVFGKFKTMMQREAEGFQIFNKNTELKNEGIKMLAHGNMWMQTDYSYLVSSLEVICLEFVDGATMYTKIYNSIYSRNDDQYKHIAQVFKQIYKLHSNGVVHGDPHPDNLMQRKSGQFVWIDYERVQKRESYFNDQTWNTLKLIDINIALVYVISNFYLSDGRDRNSREIIKRLKAQQSEYSKYFLPHICYHYSGMIYDDSSCIALNSIFNGFLDYKTLSDANMSQHKALLDLSDATKLNTIINMFRTIFLSTAAETVRFNVTKYDAYPIPIDYISNRDSVFREQSKSKISNTTPSEDASRKGLSKFPTDSGKEIEERITYYLNLDGRLMFAKNGNILCYSRDGVFKVTTYNKTSKKIIESTDVTMKLCIDDKQTPLLLDGKQCYYSVRNNLLQIEQLPIEQLPKLTVSATYDLTYYPPRKQISSQAKTKTMENSQQVLDLPTKSEEETIAAQNEEKIENGQKYYLMLDGHKMYAKDGNVLTFFFDGKYEVATYNKSTGDYASNTDYAKQLYTSETQTPFLLTGYACFYSVVSNWLQIKQIIPKSQAKPTVSVTYDLRFNPPRKQTSSNDATAKKQASPAASLKLTDLIINGDQYYSSNKKTFQVLKEDGNFFLCEEPENGTTPAKLYGKNMIVVKRKDGFKRLIDSSKGNNASLFMDLNEQGRLDIFVKTGKDFKFTFSYDLTKTPIQKIMK